MSLKFNEMKGCVSVTLCFHWLVGEVGSGQVFNSCLRRLEAF